MTQQKDRLKQPPFAILRGGYKYKETLGMRRVTTYCMDMVESKDVLYVLIRADGNGGHIRRINWKDEDLDIFGNFNWPVQMIQDSEGVLYVSDEGDNCIHSLVDDGEKGFVPIGGAGKGDTAKLESSTATNKIGEGELNSPAGIAFDQDENILVVDTGNNRILKFDKSGKMLGTVISNNDENSLDMPWGIVVNHKGDILVSDWRNNRICVYDSEGKYQNSFGEIPNSLGQDYAQLSGPAGLSIDDDGDIYVADRDNDRVVIYDQEGKYVTQFTGDATLSKIGKTYIMSSPRVLRLREMSNREIWRKLRAPASVRTYGNLIYIPDFGCHRIQVYEKESYPLTKDEIFEQPNHPTLYNV